MNTTSTVRTVGIVGAGTMGRRIAYACVACGVRAQVYDVSGTALNDAVTTVRQYLAEISQPTTIDLDQAITLLSPCKDILTCAANADWLIETVPEDLELKRQVLQSISTAVGPDTFIASNTSSLPGSWLANSLDRPERFINMNFGTPSHPKVEVMGHSGTSPETIDAATCLLRQLNLIPIVALREIQGYPTNRIWRAIKKESLHLIADGYMTADNIDRAWMLDWHVSVGPCGIMDQVGLDVVRDIENVYYATSGDPSDKPPRFLEEMVERGELGVKSGKGFYEYPSPVFEQEGWLTATDE